MQYLSLVIAASTTAAFESPGSETCMDQHFLQSQQGVNLLQTRHGRSDATRDRSRVNPSGAAALQTRHGRSNATWGRSLVNPSGAAAPLDEVGYAAVSDRCCQAEMKVFIERQIFHMGLEVCEPAGLNGIVPYHSCEVGIQTFAALTSNLLEDSSKQCKWLATIGNCKPLDPGCPTFADVEP